MLVDYAAAVGGFSFFLLGLSALLPGRQGLAYRGPLLLVTLLALSFPGFALERRHGRIVDIAPNETVDDTLWATGNSVRVDGVVNGDLLASGRSVEVRGTINGDLISWADTVEVSGTVEGHIYDFSHTLDLDGQVGRSVYGVMQSLHVTDRGHVGDGILAAAGEVNLEGEVKRSVSIATGNADVSGTIGRDLNVSGHSLTLTNIARVGGNLNARLRQLNDAHIAEGATVAGKRNIQVRERRSHFTSPRFYFRQTIWFAAALLVGWLGLILFPNFFRATALAVGSGWRSFALGLAILAAVPLIILVAAITLVGIPISLMLLASYFTAIYLAKIWVGAFLGHSLLKLSGTTKRDWLVGLLVGLLILTTIGFVPYLGGLVGPLVLCLGLGAFGLQLYRLPRPPVAP